MQDTGRVATTLAGDSARITETVNLINEITAQTNLLALNAAIEAARAGEVGRGFAVVADEVRALAERTRQSTNEIREVVKGLTASIEEIVSSVLSLGDRSQRISDNVDGFRHSFEAVAEGAKSNIGHLHYARGLAFASLLKLDHIIFMQRGYRGLEARGADGSAVSHTDCRLGRWYYEGDGAALFGSLASFKQLEIPHQQVHGAVNKALVAARGDWLHDDQLLHTILIEMESAENASKQVMELLNRMVQEQSVT
nr:MULTISPECIES: methyl-accepting chemotaxis protein [unclassified Aeromonas]